MYMRKTPLLELDYIHISNNFAKDVLIEHLLFEFLQLHLEYTHDEIRAILWGLARL